MAVWKVKERNELAREFELRGDRQLHMGGGAPGASDVVDFASMTSAGDFSDFGNLSAARQLVGGGANQTRSICTGGQAPGVSNIIDYVQIKTTGNFSDFGDLTDQRGYISGMSNDLRQVSSGGLDPSHSNIQDVVQFATTGNAVDFGNLTSAKALDTNSGSPTRGISAGGVLNPGGGNQNLNIIDFITFATNGNATDFGDLTATQRSQSSFSSKTRMCMVGGQAPGTTKIEKIEIATTGNATDFADGLSGTTENGRGTSNNIKGMYNRGGVVNQVHQLNINAGGTATDFGDLTVARTASHAASDGHGGLELGILQRPSATYMPGSGRALFNGGQLAPNALTGTVELFHISTAGNAADFGELNTVVSNGPGNGASNTRSIIYTGYSPASPYYDNTIQATTFATLGNYFDFGDPSQQRYANSYGNIGSPTRAVFMGGYAPGSPYYVNIIDYITIATVGNGTDFGDLASATNNVAGCGSSTRGIGLGGYTGSQDDTIQYVTIASTGNATDFGNLTTAKSQGSGVSSTIRGIMAGGTTGSVINVIEYITIASTGNGTDFGDLSQSRKAIASGSNSNRGLFMGGATPSKVTTTDFITIASTGDATDFGDITAATGESAGTSDAHGGLHG